jgi:HK97 gp10 family phage protein
VKTGITVSGIDDVNRILTSIAPRDGINLMRATVQDIAQQIAKTAKQKAPDDPTTGSPDLKSSIKAKRRRGSRERVQSDVLVERFGKGDAFYWRFLEFGQGPDGVEHAFFLKALQEMRPEMERIYLEAFAKKLIARMARERKRAGG